MIRVGFGISALAQGIQGNSLDGIGNYTNELLTQFSKHTDLSLIPFSFNTDIPKFDNWTPPQNPGVQLGKYSVNTAWSIATGANFIHSNSLTSQVDLVHATDHYVPKLHGTPLVATLMDAIPLSHPNWLRGELRSVKNFLWKRAANWADEVITISEYSKAELTKWAGIPESKISVIPLGVDARWFRAVSPLESLNVRTKYDLPETFFVSVGTLQPRKNIISTIQAHRSLPDSQRRKTPLIIIGRAGWKCDEVIKIIDQESAAGTIRWLKHVPEIDLLPVLNLASAMVFPTLAEGFGLPVLEAFAAQIPVITSNTTSLPEVAGDAAISVNPLDIEQIAQAMMSVLEDPALAAELRKRGHLRATQFTWQACAAETFKIYQRMIAHRHGA